MAKRNGFVGRTFLSDSLDSALKGPGPEIAWAPLPGIALAHADSSFRF